MENPVHGHVKVGSYVNDITGRWAWFLPNTQANICVQFLGIWVTLALPRLWAGGYVFYRLGITNMTPANANRPQSTPVALDQRKHVPDPGSFALDRIYNAGLPQTRLPGPVLPRREINKTLHDLGLAVISITFFVLVIVLGVLATLLTGDSVGLAQSAGCGYYLLDNVKETPGSTAIQTRLQVDAASYAQACYGGRGNDINGCDLFAQQAIAYDVEDEADCPFQGEMCILGQKGAMKLSTGPVLASALGFNAGRYLEFQRSTTCAPLVRNETFVKKYSIGGDEELTGYQFHYGWTSPPAIAPAENSWTYEWSGANSMFIDNTYDVGIRQEGQYYEPITELRSTGGKRLTVLFVSNKRFRYPHRIDDPLFQAHFRVEAPTPNPQDDWVWWLAGPKDDSPRVLACVDDFKWRDKRAGQDWIETPAPSYGKTSSGIQDDRWLLLPLSLAVSTTWDAISLRLASGLNASSQTPPSSFFGVLAPDQWKIEVRQLFETSLARAQLETRNMVLGLYAGLPNYVKSNTTPAICHETYLINAPGYTNVFAAPWLAIFMMSSLVILVNFPTGTREYEKFLFERLFPDMIIRHLARICVVIVHATTQVLDWTSQALVSCSCAGWRCSKTLIACTLAFLAKVPKLITDWWSVALSIVRK